MKRRGRFAGVRRVAKWVGLVVCVLLVTAFCVSIRWNFGYEGKYSCEAGAGALWLRAIDPLPRPSRWNFEPRDAQILWWPVSLSGSSPNRSVKFLGLPFWMPFLAIALPTAWLWWRDRRARPGHCPCGYDLAGLAPDAACPECGGRA